uniref:Reelin domain-containing protein n=1 Tax=Branchiostoma floridae TaxID=7739 RepID=C3ZC33_BRAFL|eukprot:XP_002593794.1 hypothetical protein BRAFLDRAFT_75747 [Branchiostoma floridae]
MARGISPLVDLLITRKSSPKIYGTVVESKFVLIIVQELNRSGAPTTDTSPVPEVYISLTTAPTAIMNTFYCLTILLAVIATTRALPMADYHYEEESSAKQLAGAYDLLSKLGQAFRSELETCDLKVDKVCQTSYGKWRGRIPRMVCRCPARTMCDMDGFPVGKCVTQGNLMTVCPLRGIRDHVHFMVSRKGQGQALSIPAEGSLDSFALTAAQSSLVFSPHRTFGNSAAMEHSQGFAVYILALFVASGWCKVLDQDDPVCPARLPRGLVAGGAEGRPNQLRQGSRKPLYELDLFDVVDGFIPNGTYTVALRSNDRTQPFTGFHVSVTSAMATGCSEGVLSSIHMGVTDLKKCNVLINAMDDKKMKIPFRWEAPTCGCVTLRATVWVNNVAYYMEDEAITSGFLTKTICVYKGVEGPTGTAGSKEVFITEGVDSSEITMQPLPKQPQPDATPPKQSRPKVPHGASFQIGWHPLDERMLERHPLAGRRPIRPDASFPDIVMKPSLELHSGILGHDRQASPSAFAIPNPKCPVEILPRGMDLAAVEEICNATLLQKEANFWDVAPHRRRRPQESGRGLEWNVRLKNLATSNERYECFDQEEALFNPEVHQDDYSKKLEAYRENFRVWVNKLFREEPQEDEDVEIDKAEEETEDEEEEKVLVKTVKKKVLQGEVDNRDEKKKFKKGDIDRKTVRDKKRLLSKCCRTGRRRSGVSRACADEAQRFVRRFHSDYRIPCSSEFVQCCEETRKSDMLELSDM